MSKEWQEASNERAKEMKLNPITGTSSSLRPSSTHWALIPQIPMERDELVTDIRFLLGISSADYKGKGFVQE